MVLIMIFCINVAPKIAKITTVGKGGNQQKLLNIISRLIIIRLSFYGTLIPIKLIVMLYGKVNHIQ